MVEGKKYLYRFRHLQADHCKWTKSIITDSILYYASPSSFNDPFDCKVYYCSIPTHDQLRRYYAAALRSRFPVMPRAQLRKKVAIDLGKHHPVNFKKQMTRKMQVAANDLGILSLSANCTNILLWSHYAASHTGICLKFHVSNESPFFASAQEVKYRESYPKVALLQDSKVQVNDFILRKAIDWKYEEEWRIIEITGAGNRHFPEELLEEVIFGVKMESSDKKAVLSWLDRRKYPVKVSQACLKEGTYSLEIKPYVP